MSEEGAWGGGALFCAPGYFGKGCLILKGPGDDGIGENGRMVFEAAFRCVPGKK